MNHYEALQTFTLGILGLKIFSVRLPQYNQGTYDGLRQVECTQ